ncbi:hypothetical protein SDC9_05926 [bioreactor metagenome]|uniref:Large ribosomal RNA subunit accumulation protein YceD n=1 Tax=bioreactor metagenome TaxID=1076179 RepID=A0A644T0E1_9ZZZZ|nr:DUF177 domain-containing protein [Negativicutes bacterium]
MKINIQQVKNHIGAKQNFRLCFSAADLFEKDEYAWINDPIVATGEVINEGLLLKVSGTIDLVATFLCDRCLEKHFISIAIPFFEKYQESGAENSSDEITLYQGEEITIHDLVRESLILAKPLKTVCSEDCHGLCPKCGTNLNISTCACKKGVIDPRLAALQQLLDKK